MIDKRKIVKNDKTKRQTLRNIEDIVEKGNYTLARKALFEFLEKNPLDYKALSTLALVYLKTGDEESAMETYEYITKTGNTKKLSNNNGSYYVAHANFALAKKADTQDDYDRAKEYYDYAIEIGKEKDRSYYINCLAELEIKNGNIKEGNRLLKYLEETGRFGDIEENYLYVKALELYTKGKYEEAEKIFPKYYSDTKFFILHSKIYTELGRLSDAKDEINQSIATLKADLYYDVIKEEYIKNMVLINNVEIEDFSKFKETSSKLIDANYKKRKQETLKDAVDLYKEVYNSDIEILKCYSAYELGVLHFEQGDFASAKKYFNESLSSSNELNKSAVTYLIGIAIRENDIEKGYILTSNLDSFEGEVKEDLLKSINEATNKFYILKNYKHDKNYKNIQQENYKKEFALRHIKEGHGCDKFIARKSRFTDSVDIDRLFERVENSINSKERELDVFYDIYMMRMDGIGYQDNERCDYLRVVTLPDSKYILSMYPVKYKRPSAKDYFDEIEMPKKEIKIPSQIERFNKKWGNVKSKKLTK